jgi:hypothetical protein
MTKVVFIITRTALVFAALGYLVALGLYFAPLHWHIPPAIVYAICPAAILTITVDPSFGAVALLLGPAMLSCMPPSASLSVQ